MAGMGYMEIVAVLFVGLLFLSPSNMRRFLADFWRAWLFLRSSMKAFSRVMENFFHNLRVMDFDQKGKKNKE